MVYQGLIPSSCMLKLYFWRQKPFPVLKNARCLRSLMHGHCSRTSSQFIRTNTSDDALS